jgi:TRAP transporter TAXI family solute receptor
MRSRYKLVFWLVVLTLLSACAAPAAPAPGAAQPSGEKTRLVIVTGGTGGVFFPYGGGLARIITEKMPNTEATAEVTGGSVDNMKLIGAGDADIGLSTVDSAYDAIQGVDAYADTGPIPAQTIAVLYPSFLHVIALAESGITTIPDMRGRRISVGSAGSSTEIAANRVLEAAGLDPMNDITRDNLSVAESVAAMKDKKIDAFFWIAGLPTPAVTDLATTPNLPITFIDISQYLDSMVEKYGPVYSASTLPMETYNGMTADVPGVGINNILFVNEAMPDEMVHSILTTIFDNLEEVSTVHPEAEKLSLEYAVQGSSIPFHPGAIQFYTERGVWKD